MLTPKETSVVRSLRENAAVTGASDVRTKSELRRGQRTLLAVIDRLAGADALAVCRLVVKWHQGVSKSALKLENGYPVDRTDIDEAARLAHIALAGAPPADVPVLMTDDEILAVLLCDDCPPMDYPTDKTRCRECPRRSSVAA